VPEGPTDSLIAQVGDTLTHAAAIFTRQAMQQARGMLKDLYPGHVNAVSFIKDFHAQKSPACDVDHKVTDVHCTTYCNEQTTPPPRPLLVTRLLQMPVLCYLLPSVHVPNLTPMALAMRAEVEDDGGR
jgi:hypothetical protein